jgi:hypothetical protein
MKLCPVLLSDEIEQIKRKEDITTFGPFPGDSCGGIALLNNELA